MMTNTDYAHLANVLTEAYEQAASGKGKERHAKGQTFDRQPILEIGRMVGPGYELGQAMKKAQESFGMWSRGETGRAVAECLGAINYLAATVILMREMPAPVKTAETLSPETVRAVLIALLHLDKADLERVGLDLTPYQVLHLRSDPIQELDSHEYTTALKILAAAINRATGA